MLKMTFSILLKIINHVDFHFFLCMNQIIFSILLPQVPWYHGFYNPAVIYTFVLTNSGPMARGPPWRPWALFSTLFVLVFIVLLGSFFVLSWI